MPSDQYSPVQLRRAVISSFLGSVIEYYDFLLYATASAVVFARIFFSDLDPLVATVASLGTFATGYLARPLGGVLFGHFGDIIGRKRMLILTMVLMGTASFIIGLLPTYEQVGAWAPVALVALRVVQGVAVGGEWGGAVLMSAEHASTRRGLWASFTGAGAPFGMVLSTTVLTGSAAVLGEDAFLAWGWRIPFLLSLALLGVGLFVRLKVDETPVFREASATRKPPLLTVLREHPRALLLGVGVGLAAFVVQTTLTTYLLAYGVQVGYSRQTVLVSITLSSLLAVFGTVFWSGVSDRFGRRPIMMIGAVLVAAYGFALFPMVHSGSAAVLAIALVLGQSVLHPMIYGPLAALYTELFSTRARYTGASLGYQIAALGGGVAPVIFAQLQSPVGTSLIIAGCCALTVVCSWVLPETSRDDLVSVRRLAREAS